MTKTLGMVMCAWAWTGLQLAGSARAGNLDPTNAPAPTMHTLEEIYQKVGVLAPSQTLSATTTVVIAGYYASTNLTLVEGDLAAANIKSGATLFGVAGSNAVVDTTAGTAVAGDLLAGKTAYVRGAVIAGTLATPTFSSASTTVAAGRYAATNLTQVDADLATANIKAGSTIFGVAGSTAVLDTTAGTATASDLLSGKTAYAKGALISGAIATPTLSPATTAVAAGHYAATTLNAVDPDLVTGNIKSGATIFGVAGSNAVVDTAAGTAVAGDMLSGKTGFARGVAISGTIATPALSPATATVSAGYYAATTLNAVDADLTTANIKAGITIFGVAGSNAVVDTTAGTAAAGDMLAGKTAYVKGATITGTLATQTLSPANAAQPAGYYAATNLTVVDTDLTALNIRTNVQIFGIVGTLNTNAGGATYSAGVARTGQTNSWQTSDDGTYRKGVAWPNPRFTVGLSGPATNCVADNLTGLMWTRNANHGLMSWPDALTYCEGLAYGGYTDWRLPNLWELLSLVDFGRMNPPLCNTVGTGQWANNDPYRDVQLYAYWSSTTVAYSTLSAWYVVLSEAGVSSCAKINSYNYYVWPVRSGP